MKVAGLFFLLVATHLLSSENCQAKCIERERNALLNFKEGLVDDGNLLWSWKNKSKDCCAWRGIRCNNLTNHIIKLDLHFDYNYFHHLGLMGYPISGQIGSSLVDLQHLEHLDLSNNDFVTIPKFIGAITRLKYLNLSGNPIVGNIPSQLGNLTKLSFLDLDSLTMGLIVDNFHWLSNLPNLRLLRLGGTKFSKAMDWFQSFKAAPSLSILEFNFCYFPILDIAHSLSHINSSNSLTKILVEACYSVQPKTFSKLLNLSNNLVDFTLKQSPSPLHFLPNSFENLKFLTHIDVSENRLYGFEGEILKYLGNLCNLQQLILRENGLNGTQLIDFLQSHRDCGNKNSLEVLDLSSNQLEGSLPHNLIKLSSLRELDLSYNKLSGNLPKSVGELSSLEILDISMNSFVGDISNKHLGKLSKLLKIDLSSTSLSLNFSPNWAPSFQLQYINLGSCKLGPQFPSWLQTQMNISFLNLSSSGISNVIPSWFPKISSGLEYLDLSFNLINGTLPNVSLRSKHSSFIDLSSNNIHGSIPNSLLNAKYLDLSNNFLTEFGPFFCATTRLDMAKLIILDLSNNLLFGKIPDCWLSLNNLEVLKLDNNKLFGPIPTSMVSMYKIKTLSLRNNNLWGDLPSLKSCTQLQYFDVGENKLEGNIPTWIGESLTILKILVLKANKFHGAIPTSLCHLNYIQILDLSQNYLSGNVPSCINNFTLLVNEIQYLMKPAIFFDHYYGQDENTFEIYQDNAMIWWKGREYKYKELLELLRIIDLSSNRLVGEIPKELTNLVELIQLNLSRNNLSGAIPNQMGNLSKLESLDLSHNNFCRQIPMGLAEISTLAYMDISYNQLLGRIPTSTQLQSFPISWYLENPGLCGPPLSPRCPGEVIFKDLDPNLIDKEGYIESDDEEWYDMAWFLMGIGVGFGLGFLEICVVLILGSYWGFSYFRCFSELADNLHVMISIRISRLRR
ncbi:hypothetical protein F8388_010497 [Cannabis sativa]|uniref:Leucine-rich repeat-containing N-terminal plant-type domain-containing protein n=1 Tax=Cannabis sativa TaxID=3483 RepID=A0A7J6GS54_CANSA|nr:hypothetical protein G4B88_016852 [Cannabis sativa]KAF4384899.1 hypothetical protein F8388_010497 [Cannabis sativa]